MASATGFYSTASDVVRYASAHFPDDDRLVNDDAKRLLQRTEWEVEGTDTSYGLGFGDRTIGDRRVLGHGGGYPGHITRTFFDPVDRLAVSVLTNAIDGPALTYGDGGRSTDRPRRRPGHSRGGLPCGSPRLIAACHVLHRRPAPRHPPYALSSLTMTLTLLRASCLRATESSYSIRN